MPSNPAARSLVLHGDGSRDDIYMGRVTWSAQPLWFGDAGAGGGIWSPDDLEPYDGDGEPAWRDRHGT